MSDPKVIIEVSETGAAKTEKAIDEVAKAQERSAEASKEAAKAAEESASKHTTLADSIERVTAAESRRRAAANRLAKTVKSAPSPAKQAAETAKVATATESLASSQRKQAAAAATSASAASDAAAAFGGQSAAARALAGGVRGATLALRAIAKVAHILPALGLSGAILLIYKGFVALTQAITGSNKAAEGWVRISKAAANSTKDYAAALKDMPQLTSAATAAQVHLTQEVARAASERAKYLAIEVEARRELSSADAEEKAAAAALKHARSIDELSAANARARGVAKTRAQASNVLAFAQLKLTAAEERHRAAIDAVYKSDQARIEQMRRSVVLMGQTAAVAESVGRSLLKYAAPGVGGGILALMDKRKSDEGVANLKRLLGIIDKEAAKPPRVPRASRAAAAPAQDGIGQGARDLYAAGLERLKSATAAANAADEDALTQQRQREQERMRLYAEGVDARIAATKRERDAQVQAQTEMANAMIGSAQSYAAAALAAVVYGGSISEAINATARAAFVEGTVGALGALAKAAVFSVINPPAVAPMLAAAKIYGAQAAIAAGIASGTGGLTGGGGGGGSTAITEPTPADFGEPEKRERQDSEIFVNFASGQGGRPLSRADAAAIIGALADLTRTGGRSMGASRA